MAMKLYVGTVAPYGGWMEPKKRERMEEKKWEKVRRLQCNEPLKRFRWQEKKLSTNY